MPNLISLVENSNHIKQIKTGAGKDVSKQEITKAQNFADSYIEGKLGIQFNSPNIPDMIKQIADMVASSRVYKYVHNSQAPKESENAKTLWQDANDLLDMIISGELGLMMPDGSFHPKYRGKSEDIEENTEDDRLEIL